MDFVTLLSVMSFCAAMVSCRSQVNRTAFPNHQIEPGFKVDNIGNTCRSDDRCPIPNAPEGLSVTVYSEPNFGGQYEAYHINSYYGCLNLPAGGFPIRSLLSSGTIQVTLHYGQNCLAHVISQYQGGSEDVQSLCPGSIFLKFHRRGSC